MLADMPVAVEPASKIASVRVSSVFHGKLISISFAVHEEIDSIR